MLYTTGIVDIGNICKNSDFPHKCMKEVFDIHLHL